jgi:hypothetical protein
MVGADSLLPIVAFHIHLERDVFMAVAMSYKEVE